VQVHLATLKSGERVVVKVQRPGLKDLFDIDLKNIRCQGVQAVVISPCSGRYLAGRLLLGRAAGATFLKVASEVELPAHAVTADLCSCQLLGIMPSHAIGLARLCAECYCCVLFVSRVRRALAVWLQKVDPKTDGAARDWVAIYDECSRILYQEIDYTLEGQNADRFRNNFGNVDWIKVGVLPSSEACLLLLLGAQGRTRPVLLADASAAYITLWLCDIRRCR
jgi:hypothetical protein